MDRKEEPSALQDKTKDLFGNLFVPYDYAFELQIIAATEENSEVKEEILFSVEKSWFFARGQRVGSFQTKYIRVSDSSEAQYMVSKWNAESAAEIGFVMKPAEEYGNVLYKLEPSKSDFKKCSRIILRFQIKSTRSGKLIKLTQITQGHQELTSRSKVTTYADFQFPVKIKRGTTVKGEHFVRRLKLAASYAGVVKIVTPHLGLNKMDISKHLTFSGGYWIAFDRQAFEDSLKTWVSNPPPILSSHKNNLEKLGKLQTTGDSMIDDCWNYIGLKFERFKGGDDRVRGFYPFIGARVSSKDENYSSYQTLKAIKLGIEGKKQDGSLSDTLEKVSGHIERAIQVCETAKHGAIFSVSFNTYGATMGRIPNDIYSYKLWDAITLQFHVKEGVHQRELESEEIFGHDGLTFRTEQISQWIDSMRELEVPAPKADFFVSGGKDKFDAAVYCPAAAPNEPVFYYLIARPVSEDSFSINLYMHESKIIEILQAK